MKSSHEEQGLAIFAFLMPASLKLIPDMDGAHQGEKKQKAFPGHATICLLTRDSTQFLPVEMRGSIMLR